MKRLHPVYCLLCGLWFTAISVAHPTLGPFLVKLLLLPRDGRLAGNCARISGMDSPKVAKNLYVMTANQIARHGTRFRC